jgi:hypothetical protein
VRDISAALRIPHALRFSAAAADPANHADVARWPLSRLRSSPITVVITGLLSNGVVEPSRGMDGDSDRCHLRGDSVGVAGARSS